MADSPGSIVIDSARAAWAHTRAVLFDRFDAGRWLKLAFIAMLGASMGGGGGGGNFSVPSPGGGEGEPGAEMFRGLARAAEYVREHILELLALLIGLLVLWLVMVLVVAYVRCVFRFIFVDAVRLGGRRSIRQAWSLHTGQGLSLLLWYLVLALVTVLLIGLAMLPVILGAAALASGQTILAVLGVGGLVAVIAMVAVAVIIVALLQALTQELLVPAMYVRHSGVMDGWRAVSEAWRGRFWDIVLYFLLKTAIGLGVAFLSLVLIIPVLLLMVPGALTVGALVAAAAAMGLEGMQMALYLGVPLLVGALGFSLALVYLMQCLFLPVSVFMQAYSLAFVGRMDGRLRTL